MKAADLLHRYDLQPDSPLWRFALDLWQKPEISELCLGLQDRGWSVTRILCAVWLASRGQAFEQEPAGVPLWRQQVTGPLRAIRQSLPKDIIAAAELRTCLARAELEAERIELAMAYAGLCQPNLAGRQDTADAGRWLERNLRNAGPGNHEPDGTTENLVNALGIAAEQHLAQKQETV